MITPIIKKICTVSLGLLLNSSAVALAANDTQLYQLFHGEPTLSKLNPSLKKTKLFSAAPIATAKQLVLSSSNAIGSNYSSYVISPKYKKGNRSIYRTDETIYDGAMFSAATRGSNVLVHGRGVSFGGIFWPLELMTITNHNGQKVYYNKLAITSIKPISGHLFPLKVGNDLKFYFTRIHIQRIGQRSKTYKDRGIMEYKVTQKTMGYDHGAALSGPIYTIEVLESTRRNRNFHLTDEYQYAPKLGWYVTDIYFKKNRVVARYYLSQWSK